MARNHVTVQKDWQLAETTSVKYFLNNVKILLVILLLILCDGHIVVILCVLSHGCDWQCFSTDLAQSPAIIDSAVAELEPFRILRVVFHMLCKDLFVNIVCIAHKTVPCPKCHTSEIIFGESTLQIDLFLRQIHIENKEVTM